MELTKVHYEYSKSEKTLMFFAGILFAVMFASYITETSIRKIIFPTKEEKLLSTPVGKVLSTSGQVLRQRASDFEFKNIGTSDTLFPNDTLTTGAGGGIKFQLSTGEIIDLEPNSLIKLSFGSDFAVTGVVKIAIVKIATKPVIVERAPVVIPIPKPKPTPKPVPNLAISNFLPLNGANIAFTKDDLIKGRKAIPLSFSVNTLEHRFTLKLMQSIGSSQREVLVKKPEPALEHNFATQFNSAGKYDIEIFDDQEKSVLKSHFTIKREVSIIHPQPTRGNTNKLEGSATKKDFDGFTLNWQMDAIPSIDPTQEYTIRVFNKSSQKLLLQKSMTKTELTLNKNNLILGKLYYLVERPLKNGFVAVSPKEEFGFEFLPPDLTSPPDRGVISQEYLSSHNNRVFLTWSKTNYTTKYEVEVSNAPNFGATILKKQLMDNFDTVLPPSKGTFYWRVRSLSQGMWSEFSPSRAFNVQ